MMFLPTCKKETAGLPCEISRRCRSRCRASGILRSRPGHQSRLLGAGDGDEHVRMLDKHGHREDEERSHSAGEWGPAAAAVVALEILAARGGQKQPCHLSMEKRDFSMNYGADCSIQGIRNERERMSYTTSDLEPSAVRHSMKAVRPQRTEKITRKRASLLLMLVFWNFLRERSS